MHFFCSHCLLKLRAFVCGGSAMKERRHFACVLRQRFDRLQEHFGRAQGQYPRVLEALRQMGLALDAEVPRPELPKKRKAATGAPRAATGAPQAATGAPQAATGASRAAAESSPVSRKWYCLARRLRKERDALKAQLDRASGAKEGNVLTEEWLVRVFLSRPNASARSLEQGFGDIIGSDVHTVSRPRMNIIRDAWVELYKPMVLSAGASLVASTVGFAKCVRKSAFAPLFLVQIQDEADIRLRSAHARDGPTIPSRSRSSKVQQSVLTIHGSGEQVVRIPCELEALGDKTAATLATSFERLLRYVAAGIFTQPQAEGGLVQPRAALAVPEVWAFHILIGDGIATNEAAAKILWTCMQLQPLAPGTRYFLAVLKCATHQTGLTAKSSVVGRAAATGAGESELYKAITGVATRLFKFVINDYFEEFVFSVREWVCADLLVQPAEAGEDLAATGAAKALQRLYTEHVVPDAMLSLWNQGLGSMRHRLPPGQDPVSERPRVVNDFVQWIVKHLLHVDCHPTLSRFFTFRGCIDRMLCMALIGMPQRAFKLRSIKPRAENQKRLRMVLGFFDHPDAQQTLRRTCLAFQLTGGVEAMVSAQPSGDDPPTVVRLVRGDATSCVEGRCERIFGRMVECDPALDVASAVTLLLTVGMDLELRVKAFVAHPVALVRMCKRWFPGSYLHDVHDFLQTPRGRLDVGMGAQLHALAWHQRDEMAACSYLLSKPVQDLLEEFASVALASSLQAERGHAEVKKWEASKLTHIAVASRNAICMRYLKWRDEQCRLVACKQQALRRAVRTNLQALAWKASPQICPMPRWRPATGGPPQAAAPGQPPAVAERDPEADAAAGHAMSAFVAEHRQALEEQKRAQLRTADVELKQLLDTFTLPVTRPQWAEWLSNNIAEFRAKMQTAPTQRRQGNVRLFARPDLPAPAQRIQPPMVKTPLYSQWAKLLADRSGWWGVAARDNGFVILFMMVLRGRTYYMDMGNRAATGVPTIILDPSFSMHWLMRELHELEAALADDEVSKVMELKAPPFSFQ